MAPLRCAHSSCAARSFVHLAKRRFTTTPSPAATTHLDFLLPKASGVPVRISSGATRSPITSTSRSFTTAFPTPRRLFSTSSPRKATACVQNLVQDEEGNDMMLEITDRAAKRLSDIMKKDDNPNLALRIQVESGGCHGFQYLMSLVTIPGKDAQEYSSVVTEDDSIFEFVPEADGSGASEGGARIILDGPSLDLLKGSKVDFTMELIGSQFKIVDNPYASSSCGCGTSFDIKM